MTRATYLATLAELGITQVRFCRLIDVHPTTSLRWLELPRTVVLLLGVLSGGRATIDDLERMGA